MSHSHAEDIYDASPSHGQFWENGQRGGLLLAVCAGCSARQTRDTYCEGFWAEFFTLDQGLSIRAIARHSCGQWHRYND